MIQYSYRCDKGGRKQNQDSVLCISNGESYLFSVADGLGGYEDSALASLVVHETLKELFRTEFKQGDTSFPKRAVSISQRMLAQVKKQKKITDSYTTLVILLITGGKACWCHVGDSRLYFLRDGHIFTRTLDHSVPQALASAGMIREEEIRHHPDRSKLLRALGRDDKEIKADYSDIYELAKGDSFLLCTDGFWENVTESEIEDSFVTFADAKDALEAMETSVKDAGLSAKTDNYSAIDVIVI